MIGQLNGVLLEKLPPTLLLDVAGVGYEVEAPMSTFYELPEAGNKVRLFTHMVVREDAQLLYGFASKAERSLFRELIRVSGVGPKLALTVLSGMPANVLGEVIDAGDAAQLARIPGIGKKTAERLIVELRGRLAACLPAGAPSAQVGSSGEALDALLALGYRNAEAERLLRKVAQPGLGTESLIREALKLALKR